jgi:hypothetical protein
MKNKKLSDERLIYKRLTNFRVLYIIQTLMIIIFIILSTIKNGIESLPSNPMLFIFLVISVLSAFQEITISKDVYDKHRSASVGIGIIIALAIMGLFVLVFGGGKQLIYIGIILAIALCVFIVSVFIMRLHK